jgi:hypothetical protein
MFIKGAISFLDRVNISIAGQAVQRDSGLSNVQLGYVFSAFVIGYWREVLFWMLLLPAFGALGSIRPRGQIAGLIEACAFLLVAISSTGKLKSLGLEFANWREEEPQIIVPMIDVYSGPQNSDQAIS